MRVRRNKAKLKKMTKIDDSFVDMSSSERISIMWEITSELWSLKGSPYVKRRLQRNVANFIKQ